jgi:hypothetical protein
MNNLKEDILKACQTETNFFKRAYRLSSNESGDKKQIIDVYLKSIEMEDSVSYMVTLRDVSSLLQL